MADGNEFARVNKEMAIRRGRVQSRTGRRVKRMEGRGGAAGKRFVSAASLRS